MSSRVASRRLGTNEHVPRLARCAPERTGMSRGWPRQPRVARDMPSPHSEAWTYSPYAHSLPRKMSMPRGKNGHVPRTGRQPTQWHKKWTCPAERKACPGKNRHVRPGQSRAPKAVSMSFWVGPVRTERLSMSRGWPRQSRVARDMPSPHAEAWTYPPYAHSLPRKMSMFRGKNEHVPGTGHQPTRWHKKWTCPPAREDMSIFCAGLLCGGLLRVGPLCANRSPSGRALPAWANPSGRSGGLR